MTPPTPLAPGRTLREPEPATLRFEARALARGTRLAAALLDLILRAGTPAVCVFLVVTFDPPAGPVAPVLSCLAGLACLAASRALLDSASRARVSVGEGRVLVETRDGVAFEREASEAEATAWALALPSAGVRLALADQRGSSIGIAARDIGATIDALADAGVAGGARARAHPTIAMARERARRRPRIASAALRFALRTAAFALVPTAVFFYTHQSIAWGGPLGEYYLAGAAAWLRTFARFWLALFVIVLGIERILRLVCDGAGAAVGRAAPSLAAKAQRGADLAFAWLFYAGIPALTALRYAP